MQKHNGYCPVCGKWSESEQAWIEQIVELRNVFIAACPEFVDANRFSEMIGGPSSVLDNVIDYFGSLKREIYE